MIGLVIITIIGTITVLGYIIGAGILALNLSRKFKSPMRRCLWILCWPISSLFGQKLTVEDFNPRYDEEDAA